MALVIYFICTLTSLVCAWMLLRGYFISRAKILLWSGLCFSGLCVSNFFLIIDSLTGPEVNLLAIRLVLGLISLFFLIFGLIWDDDPI